MISRLNNNAQYVRMIWCTLGLTIVASLPGCVAIRNLKECCHKPQPAAIVAPPRTITVAGIVLRPGLYEIPPVAGLTIQKAIAEAGGFMPSGIAYNNVEGFPDPARFHEDHISRLALTLQREEITYVIPCAMVNTTELGVIRLRDRDVLTVMTLEAAGFDWRRFGAQPADQALAFEKANNEKTVRFLGATLLDGREMSLEEVGALLNLGANASVIAGETAGLFRATAEDTGKIIDWSRNPQVARVTRRASNDGRPRIFYIPLGNQFFNIAPDAKAGAGTPDALTFEDYAHQGFGLRGGDDIAYLQIHEDPLVATSQMTEQRASLVLEQIRREAASVDAARRESSRRVQW